MMHNKKAILLFGLLTVAASGITLSKNPAKAQCTFVFQTKTSVETLAYSLCGPSNYGYMDKDGYPKTIVSGLVYYNRNENIYDVKHLKLEAIVSCYENNISWSSGLRQSLSSSKFRELNSAIINHVCR